MTAAVAGAARVRALDGAAAALVVAGLVTLWLDRSPGGEPALWALVLGAGYAVLAAATARGPARPATGWFRLTAAALLAVPLLRAAGWGDAALLVAGLAVGVLVPAGLLRVVVPDRVSRAARLGEVAVLAAGAVAGVTLLVPGDSAVTAAWSVFAIALLCAGWLQFDATRGRARRQLLWLVLGVSSSVLAGLLFAFVIEGGPVGAGPAVLVVAVLSLLLPLTVGLAVLAPDALDVRRVISTTVVGALMTTAVVAVYAGGLAGFALLGGPPKPGVLGLLVAALAAGFHPVLVRVRGFVDEVLFGGRPDPVRTLTRLGDQLTAGGRPAEWLDTLRVALGAPAMVLRQDGAPVVASGIGPGATEPAGPAVTIPLRVATEQVGELVVGLPPDQLQPSPTVRAVLELVAAPLAQALRAVRLSEQLQASRGRVVAALEEERRRLRRDLHDGLGPTLTGIAYSADAARNLLPAGADAAAAELTALRADTAEAIAEIRRIVEGLRPRALDELGLLGALTQRLQRLRAADGRPMTVTFDGPDRLPELPAAVEVVAYRVVLEAVTNLARHAGVDRARVELTLDEPGGMVITVSGADGPGHAPQAEAWTPGVGLTSMRERVEQIGGVLDVTAGPAGGRIRARVPTNLDLPD